MRQHDTDGQAVSQSIMSRQRMGAGMADAEHGVLAGGGGGGGNAYRGQHRLGGFAVASIVGHGAAVGQEEIDSLGAVHGAAAAHRDEKIDVVLLSKRGSLVDMTGRGIFFHLVEDKRLKVGIIQGSDGSLRMACALPPWRRAYQLPGSA